MESVREYLIGVTAAAVICSVVNRFQSKGTIGGVIRLITGVFMALSVVAPLRDIHLDTLPDFVQGIQLGADDLVQEGENYAQQALKTIIMEQSQAYILDKADSLGATLSVEVILSEDELPIPIAVTLSGDISPYDRSVLSQYITDTLGIATEAQTWSSS